MTRPSLTTDTEKKSERSSSESLATIALIRMMIEIRRRKMIIKVDSRRAVRFSHL